MEELKEVIAKSFKKLAESISFAKRWIEKFLDRIFNMEPFRHSEQDQQEFINTVLPAIREEGAETRRALTSILLNSMLWLQNLEF